MKEKLLQHDAESVYTLFRKISQKGREGHEEELGEGGGRGGGGGGMGIKFPISET